MICLRSYMICQLMIYSCFVHGGEFEDVRRSLPSQPPHWVEDGEGPLCGLYAACHALQFIGIEALPQDFMATRYVGKCGGSTPQELANVIEDAGGRATIATRLSSFDLRTVGCPAIANVRATPSTSQFNHWVMVLNEGDQIVVYDGPDKRVKIPMAEFLGLWSGLGILVSSENKTPIYDIWLGRLGVFQFVIAAVLMVCSKRLKSIASKVTGAKSQILLIGVGTLVLALMGNALFGDLRHHRAGVATAAAPNQGQYRTGKLTDVQAAIADPAALLVDARLARDYQVGSIKRAVNIPVSASTWDIQEYLSNVPRETSVVVFCQSARCGFDEQVAMQLVGLGFENVTVCDEGYAEFIAKNSSKDSEL